MRITSVKYNRESGWFEIPDDPDGEHNFRSVVGWIFSPRYRAELQVEAAREAIENTAVETVKRVLTERFGHGEIVNGAIGALNKELERCYEGDCRTDDGAWLDPNPE